MNIKSHLLLFDLIAPVYALFFKYQVNHFRKQLRLRPELTDGQSLRILDLGSGTGALAYALSEMGHQVIGHEGSKTIVKISRRLNQTKQVAFHQVNLLSPVNSLVDLLPSDLAWPSRQTGIAPHLIRQNPPDLVMASFVLHGLPADLRAEVFRKIKACACRQVLILDYSSHRSWPVDLIEWAEGGDYFNFTRTIEHELREAFGDFSMTPVHNHVNWYSILLGGS